MTIVITMRLLSKVSKILESHQKGMINLSHREINFIEISSEIMKSVRSSRGFFKCIKKRPGSVSNRTTIQRKRGERHSHIKETPKFFLLAHIHLRMDKGSS